MDQVKDAGTEILRVLCGSRAYGRQDDDSDFDYHGFFVVPTDQLLLAHAHLVPKVSEKAWIEGEDMDNVSWEVGHFLKLATTCNPTVLETFKAPVERELGAWGIRLRELFPYVISRPYVFEAFKGYAHNQRKKMFEPTGGVRAGERMWKFAVAYLRVLHQGVELLQKQTYDPYIADVELRDFLYQVKLGNISKGEVIDQAEGAMQELCDAYVESPLPATPSMDAITEFLLDLRRLFWTA